MNQDILNAVSGDVDKYNLIMQKTRQIDIVKLRWEVFAVLHCKGYKLEAIGRLFNMHHATVMHGLKKAFASRTNVVLDSELEAIKSKIIRFR